jgi:hypothetical protein
MTFEELRPYVPAPDAERTDFSTAIVAAAEPFAITAVSSVGCTPSLCLTRS